MDSQIISGGDFMADAFEKLEALRRNVEGLRASIEQHGIPAEQRAAAQMRAATLFVVMKSADDLCRSLNDLGHVMNAHLNPPEIDPQSLN